MKNRIRTLPTATSSHFERIRFDGRTIYLKNPTESALLLTGIEVDKSGEEIVSLGYDERQRIIDLSLITSRTTVVMDKHYGELGVL